ncbi:MAG: hypothetical protein K2Q22_11040, partial [Cytophagales bacterium]|nr:hypothetical protein [Cytophagales bacterium]
MKKLLLLLISLQIGFSELNAQNQILNGGNTFSAELCSNSLIYAMGSNNAGQMGQGTTSTGVFTTPQVVPGLPTNLKMVSAGSGSHGSAVDCNGVVWTWGLNNCGQLGHSTTAIVGTAVGTQNGPPSGSCSYSSGFGPVASVPGLPKIDKVAGGNLATYAIASVTGEVWAWGMNESGQLGNGTFTNSYTPSKVINCSTGLPLTNIVQISSGDWSVYALDANGFVWSWGVNTNGSGYLSYGGFNSKGQELGRYTGCGSQATEKINCAGLVQADVNGDGIPDGNLQNITQITAGDTHGLAIDNAGGLWSWGSGWTGQTGNGNTAGLYCGTCTGAFPSFAMRVPAPGSPAIGSYSPCGSYGTNTAPSNFIGGPGQPNAIFIAAGQSSSAAVLDNGGVVTFGLNSQSGNPASPCNFGTLGTGSTSTSAASYVPQYVRTNSTTTLSGIATLSRGDGWYYAQNLAGTNIYSWGVNNYGQIGNGTTTCLEYATLVTLPSGCTYVNPCPPKPYLGGNVTICPNYIFTGIGVTPISTYNFAWQYRAVTTTGWTNLSSGTGAAFTTLTGTNIGQYRVIVSDGRSGTAIICGTCPTVGDTASILPPPCSSTPNLG